MCPVLCRFQVNFKLWLSLSCSFLSNSAYPNYKNECVVIVSDIQLSFSRFHTGMELLRLDSQAGDSLLKTLWHHSDAIMCCSMKTNVMALSACSFFLVYPIKFHMDAYNYKSVWFASILIKICIQGSPFINLKNYRLHKKIT